MVLAGKCLQLYAGNSLQEGGRGSGVCLLCRAVFALHSMCAICLAELVGLMLIGQEPTAWTTREPAEDVWPFVRGLELACQELVPFVVLQP